jgi:hypothetical protein
MSPREAAWRQTLLSLAEQALVDVARSMAVDVVFVRHDDDAVGALAYVDQVEEMAQAHRFVTARQSLRTDRAFDSLDALVRAVAHELTVPPHSAAGSRGKKGIIALLDAFLAREKRTAVATFEANIAKLGVGGDLIALARAYIEAAKAPRREAQQIQAWLTGVELTRADASAVAVSALSGRTAKRALGELTRLVRALGFAGTSISFLHADALLLLPPARRGDAFTVLRELVDNTDGGRGLFATRLLVVGGTPLFAGPKSLATLLPLVSRVAPPPSAFDAPLPSPHRPLVDLVPPEGWLGEATCPAPVPAALSHGAALRALVRACQGLPPTEAILSMSVGHERIDATIDRLFEHSAMQGSVFALLSGAYGSGKTHLLLHMEARALADRRPVLRLSLERLDADLGNPQRHLRRMLDQAQLPLPGTPSLLDWLAVWTRSPSKLAKLLHALEQIRDEETDASPAAARALRAAAASKSKPAALETILGAVDLATKPGGHTYRHDAYGRLLLWFALLERLEDCAGPVLLIDEAENLYKGGTSRSERRTAMRSLAFYCGGALPRACVVMAITPDVLSVLRDEAKELLDEVTEQRTLLTWEDAAMLRRRLVRIRAEEVPALTDAHRELLAARVRATHATVRGNVRDPAWSQHLKSLCDPHLTPREVVRRTAERLEALWWQGRA